MGSRPCARLARSTWQTEDGKRYVEIRGRANYEGEKVNVVLRFSVDHKNDNIRAESKQAQPI